MADNLTLNLGTGGLELATDEDASGNHYQKIKLFSAVADSTAGIGTGPGTEATSLRVTLPTDGTGVVKLGAGSASAGTVGLDTGTNSVGTVGIDAGSNLIGTIQGNVAHDAAGTGIQPLLGGAIAYASDGTAPGTAVAEGDISRLKSDLDGRLFVNESHPASASANDNQSTAQTATSIISAPAAGFSIYITDIMVSGAIAVNTVLIHDEDDNVLIPVINTQVSGAVVMNFTTPIKVTAAKAVEYTSSVAQQHSILINYYVGV